MKTSLSIKELMNLCYSSDSVISQAAWKKYSNLVLTKPEYLNFIDSDSPVIYQKLAETVRELDLPEVWERFFAIANSAITNKVHNIKALPEALIWLCEIAEKEKIGVFDYGDCSYSENGSLQAQAHKCLLELIEYIDINQIRQLMALASDDEMFFEVVNRRLFFFQFADLADCNIFPEGFVAKNCQSYMDILASLATFSNDNNETFLVGRLLEMFAFKERQEDVIEIFKEHIGNFSFEKALDTEALSPILKMLTKVTVFKGQKSYPIWKVLIDNNADNYPHIFEAQAPYFSSFILDSQMTFLRRYSQRSDGLKISELCFDLLRKKETSENYALFLLDTLKLSLPESEIPFWERIVFLAKHGQTHPELAEKCDEVIADQFAKLDYKNANLLDFLFLSLQNSDEFIFKLVYRKIDLKMLHPKAEALKAIFADAEMSCLSGIFKERFEEVMAEIFAHCTFDYEESIKIAKVLERYKFNAQINLRPEAQKQKEQIDLIENF